MPDFHKPARQNMHTSSFVMSLWMISNGIETHLSVFMRTTLIKGDIWIKRLGGIYIEGFDFINFWDDNEYALREYVCNPPSDELIAELEAGFGYKLPRCGRCIRSCPHHAWKRDAQGYPVFQRKKCENCYRCIHHCTAKALSLSKRKRPKKLLYSKQRIHT